MRDGKCAGVWRDTGPERETEGGGTACDPAQVQDTGMRNRNGKVSCWTGF